MIRRKYAIAVESVVTQSAEMRRLISESVRVAQSSASVLLTGESGTGKELFARILHHHSKRCTKQFVRVNCAALSMNLVESELFGHEKGSFTDAVQKRIGRFEFANGGTLLLDEITEIPIATQAKLLRTLEENEFQRVGSNDSVHSDVRVVATSNRNLKDEISAGRFRLDLYHRLNVIEMRIPPLRERAIDIPLLTTHFFEKFKSESSIQLKGMTKSALQILTEHKWHGNVRELRNIVHRACVVARHPWIDHQCLGHLNSKTTSTDSSEQIPDCWLGIRLAEIEKKVILAAISKFGSKQAAAHSLGVTARTLSNKLKSYAEPVPDSKVKAA